MANVYCLCAYHLALAFLFSHHMSTQNAIVFATFWFDLCWSEFILNMKHIVCSALNRGIIIHYYFICFNCIGH